MSSRDVDLVTNLPYKRRGLSTDLTFAEGAVRGTSSDASAPNTTSTAYLKTDSRFNQRPAAFKTLCYSMTRQGRDWRLAFYKVRIGCTTGRHLYTQAGAKKALELEHISLQEIKERSRGRAGLDDDTEIVSGRSAIVENPFQLSRIPAREHGQRFREDIWNDGKISAYNGYLFIFYMVMPVVASFLLPIELYHIVKCCRSLYQRNKKTKRTSHILRTGLEQVRECTTLVHILLRYSLQICAHKSVESAFKDDMSFQRSVFGIIQLCIISIYLLPALSGMLFVGKFEM
jgi:hypothetical protein